MAINIDEAGKRVALRNAQRLRLRNLKLYLDPRSITARIPGLQAMPSTYMFDRQGYMLGRLEGAAEWDSPEAHALIHYFIDNPDYTDRFVAANG